MQTVRVFVGMDVHKETISISVAEDGRNGPVRFIGVIPNQPDDIAKMRGKSAEEVSTVGMLRAYRERNAKKTEITEVA